MKTRSESMPLPDAAVASSTTSATPAPASSTITDLTMRYTLSFLALCLFVGCTGPQQTTGLSDAAAPAKVQTVAVHSDRAPADAYRTLVNELEQRGYTLGRSDPSGRTLTTALKDFGSYQVEMRGRVSAGGTGSVVRLSGAYTVPAQGPERFPIEKIGLEGTVPRNAWAEMHAVAESLGGNLHYE